MKKVLLFTLALVTVFSLAACSEIPQPTEDPNSISFRDVDFSGADRVVVQNLHNGRDNEITAPEEIKEITKLLRSVRGNGKQSNQDQPGGTYGVTVFSGEEELFTISFGGDGSFAYGDFGDGFPCRYHLLEKTSQEMTDFFSVYDASLSGSAKRPA